MGERDGDVNGAAVNYSVKELLAQQDKKLDNILQAVTNTVAGYDAMKERLIKTEALAARNEKDISDQKTALYLAGQNQAEELGKLREVIVGLDTHQEVADALSSQRKLILTLAITSLGSIATAIVALFRAFGR